MKGQQHAAPLLAILVFFFVFAFIIGSITGHNFILNPIVLGSVITLIIIAIGAGNTPVARGVAIAAAITLMMSTFIVDFVSWGVPLQLFTILVAPLTIVFLFIFLETSKS